jgi:hypothetical protein
MTLSSSSSASSTDIVMLAVKGVAQCISRLSLVGALSITLIADSEVRVDTALECAAVSTHGQVQ